MLITQPYRYQFSPHHVEAGGKDGLMISRLHGRDGRPGFGWGGRLPVGWRSSVTGFATIVGCTAVRPGCFSGRHVSVDAPPLRRTLSRFLGQDRGI
jgi:hypothetical protein